MKCNVAIVWMHEYLDDDLPREQVKELKAHLLVCPDCRQRFDQLQRTDAMIHATMVEGLHEPASDGTEAIASRALTEKIMASLPKQRHKQGWASFIRKHPALTVAVVFGLVMFSSFLAMWGQNSELIVRGQNVDLEQLVIEDGRVVVPEGAQIRGNLTIENGVADVYGEVLGNLTVIDGSTNLASTAKIVGENRQINQAIDWLWYKVTTTVSGLNF
ncbi:hypothetical protein PA598K_04554 [Paenibacillus sp. 598K]|uniref:zf-HC2 domain-containing protein n=1 Tax=Paenibacillus sp. 598K TaxID=1117987 RepID=UPI000FF945DF|nr:zf-HC2 domain-containing protein [Paenibacillus sp. 598K]GBF76106.1 hypothetical protein PA598K_04554 [Paenibacillus sp. 598K]